MSARRTLLPLFLTALSWSVLTAQQPVPTSYPERDELTPFRNPSEVYAPPDRLFSQLRRMRAIAANPACAKQTDDLGREIVDDKTWAELFGEVMKTGLDAGYLAAIMRTSKNVDDRRTAFYAMFYCDRVDHIFNLISHIPGEPLRATRQEAFARAAEYLRVHLKQRFGDLTDDRKKEMLAAMPQIGSPAAIAAGILRAPSDADHLHELRLVPFIQLLDVDEAIDQAQALWFLTQVFAVRPDLAQRWFEPALPRVRQLLTSDSEQVRQQVLELLRTIGGKDVGQPPVDDVAALRDWAEKALEHLFPPIRSNRHGALIQLFPSPEREAIAAAAVAALENSSIGDPYVERQSDGSYLRGFRVARVPEALAKLAIPAGAIVTTVNGAAVLDAKTLLSTTRMLIEKLPHPRKLIVEYVLDGKSHAVEYYIM